MKMASSRFFIPLKRTIVHILFLLLLLPLADCVADIGETHTLKEKRNALMNQLLLLKMDSAGATLPSAQAWELKQEIIRLDEQIFASYDETVNRMAAQKIRNDSNGRKSIYIAMASSVLALFFALMLLMARSRILANGTTGIRQLYQQLTLDFIGKVSVEKAASQRMLRVNVVVVFGLIVMTISIMAYLIKSL